MTEVSAHPEWLDELAAGELEVAVRKHGELKLPTGSIIACDPLVFLESSPAFSRRVRPGRYPVEVGEDEGDVLYAAIRFADDKPVRWEPAQVVGHEAPPHGVPAYPVDSGTGCFVDAKVAALLIEAREQYVERAAAWVLGQGVDPDDADAWRAACDRYQRENPPPLADVRAGDVRDVSACDGNLVTFPSGAGDGAYASFWGFDAEGRPVCLITDFALLDEEMPDDAEIDAAELDESAAALAALSSVLGASGALDGQGETPADASSRAVSLEDVLELASGGDNGLSAIPAGEIDVDVRGDTADDGNGVGAEDDSDSPWVMLAQAAVDLWTSEEQLELEPGGRQVRLVDELADFLAGVPGPKELEDWLIDQAAVVEVYASGEALHGSLAGIARRLDERV